MRAIGTACRMTVSAIARRFMPMISKAGGSRCRSRSAITSRRRRCGRRSNGRRKSSPGSGRSPGPVFETLALAAFWALLRAQKPEAVALMDPGLVAAAQRGRLVSQEQYFDATVRRAALGQSLRQFFERWDLLLSPTMPIPAPYAEPRQDGAPGPDNFLAWTTYTYAFNLTKNPSASINCGLADGLPIGLMITGPLFGDAAVLQAAHAFERAAGRSWPGAELERRLAAIAAPADAGVKAKIWPKTR